ncbi:hypothetical protein BVH03_23855 [Pseudomonas sp. PA15(2017)]|uniref:DUF2790 domain-containing protein n=1 Tax=Pseudomonas sp. PA15(2017) TaxID=1932111 RepID=UPI000964CAAD|nr:DUF2790 domain-containing protein [Pseudomonas sp. PA15(2017)]OLU23257.1 hypothetical protein BVH03_23855 [Pseudomonas sp. PA15(2017)]
MKIKIVLLSIALLSSASLAQATSSVEKLTEKHQQENVERTRQYAEKVGKPAPQIVDYKYGMKIDVAKLIHTSRDIKTCGNFKKIMSYEDSAGNLNAVRYTLQGECVNQR